MKDRPGTPIHRLQKKYGFQCYLSVAVPVVFETPASLQHIVMLWRWPWISHELACTASTPYFCSGTAQIVSRRLSNSTSWRRRHGPSSTRRPALALIIEGAAHLRDFSSFRLIVKGCFAAGKLQCIGGRTWAAEETAWCGAAAIPSVSGSVAVRVWRGGGLVHAPLMSVFPTSSQDY